MTTYTAAGAIAAFQSGTTGTFDVIDSEANVLANLSGLETIGYARDLSSLTLTDPSDPIAITAATWDADLSALTVSGTYSVVVTGAQAYNAGIYFGSHITSVSLVDSAANVGANLGEIHLMNIDSVPYTVTLTDSGTAHFTVSVNDWISNRTVFANIQGGNFTVAIAGPVPATSIAGIPGMSYVSSVAVSDSASGIGAGLDALKALIGDGKLTSLTMTGGTSTPIPITIAQITSDADVLALLPAGYKLAISTNAANAASAAALPNVATIAVSDGGANLAANLDALEALATAGKLLSVTPTDYAALPITQAQVTADAQALAKFSFYGLDEIVSASYAGTAINQPNVADISVSDTAANISTNLSTIQTLATALRVANITVTDGGVIQATDAQYNTQENWRFFLSGAYSISISGVNYGSMSSRLFDSHVSSVGVVDSAISLPYDLDNLELTAKSGRLASISLSDGGTPTLSLTAVQISSDADALTLMTSPYTLTATGASVANAVATANIGNVSKVAVSDTLSNIFAGMSTLQTLASQNKLAGVSVSDVGNMMTLSAAQWTADKSVIGTMSGNYHLILQGITASDALSVSVGNLRSATIIDTAADIVAHFDALEGLAVYGEIASITLTDASTPTLALSSTQIVNDAQVLAVIQSPYNLAANGTLTVATLVAQSSGGHGVSGASVSDTAAHVAAQIDLLQSDVAAGNVVSIALTDSGTPILSITSSQLTSDAAALHVIVGAYGLDVTQVLAANASTIAATSNVSGVAVSDTAANIAADLDGLQSLLTAGKLTAVTITDGGSLSLTAAQMVSDAQIINDIAGNYTLTVTDASLSQLTSSAVSHASAITVSDSAANISSNLDTLQSFAAAGKLTSATITDSGFSTIAVTSTQLANDATAINDLSGNFIVKIDASAANLSLSGVSGHGNTVSFTDPASDYAVSAATTGNTVIITDTGTGRTSTDHLSGITALQFGSQTDIVAQTPGTAQVTTGNVTELYGAVFGRLPDVPGLNYYENKLQSTPTLALTTFAQWFLASPEYADNTAHNYAQTTAGDTQFITDSYTNLLGRAPEAGAIPYYLNIINIFTQGLAPGTAAYTAALAVGHAYVLTDFSASAEFLGDVTVTAQNPSSSQHWLILTS